MITLFSSRKSPTPNISAARVPINRIKMGLIRVTHIIQVSSTPFLVNFNIYLHFNLFAFIFVVTKNVAYVFTQGQAIEKITVRYELKFD